MADEQVSWVQFVVHQEYVDRNLVRNSGTLVLNQVEQTSEASVLCS